MVAACSYHLESATNRLHKGLLESFAILLAMPLSLIFSPSLREFIFWKDATSIILFSANQNKWIGSLLRPFLEFHVWIWCCTILPLELSGISDTASISAAWRNSECSWILSIPHSLTSLTAPLLHLSQSWWILSIPPFVLTTSDNHTSSLSSICKQQQEALPSYQQ